MNQATLFKLILLAFTLWGILLFSDIFAKDNRSYYVFPSDLMPSEVEEEHFQREQQPYYRYKIPNNIQPSCNRFQDCVYFPPPMQRPGSNPFYK